MDLVVSSLMSVSLEPPLIRSFHRAPRTRGRACGAAATSQPTCWVGTQRHSPARAAAPGSDCFASITWTPRHSGARLPADAPTFREYEIVGEHPGGR